MNLSIRACVVAPFPPRTIHSAAAARLVRVCLLLSVVCVCQDQLLAQAYSRTEIGALGASLTLRDAISDTEGKGGFGARLTYNVSPILAWDAEGDFFPSMARPGQQRGGRAFMVLVGPKAGWRWHRVGFFVKARPGIVNFSNVARVDPEVCDGVPCPIIFPGGHVTHLALDLGGTMEINTSRRTFIRIDVSEMLLRYGDHVYRFAGVPGAAVTTEGVIGNSLLVTAGVSYRLGSVADRLISTQSVRRWEIGGQYGVLSLGRAKIVGSDRNPAFRPLYLGDDKGFGGRLTYNFNHWLAMDAAINYFYTDSRLGDAQRGGKILQGAFGPKVGLRTQRYGVFAKVRPGFLSYGSVHDNNFPPFPTNRLTHFAVDFGGVLEYYPSRRTMLRFDLGHTAVFYGSKTVAAPAGPPFYGNFVDRGFKDNGMQFTTGFGWRF